MPGLKAMTEKKGLLNISTIMDRRQLERTQQEEISQEIESLEQEIKSSEADERVETTISDASVITTKKMYGKIFDDKIGMTTRHKYETGKLPHLHKLFFEAILEAMGNDSQKQIILTPILENLSVSRAQSIHILSCLEHYEYLSLERMKNSRGKLLMFKILKK
jgi:predicted Zn-dependent protease with MMP-like domain